MSVSSPILGVGKVEDILTFVKEMLVYEIHLLELGYCLQQCWAGFSWAPEFSGFGIQSGTETYIGPELEPPFSLG